MKLVVPTRDDCEQVRLWRNECLETLRTPYPLTKEMQEGFYDNVICNPNSPHRYWAIWLEPYKKDSCFIGMGGVTFIEWENRLGRISLIIDPQMRDKGYGEQAMGLLLDKAFNYLNLQTACGECYHCNPTIRFWSKIIKKYRGIAISSLNKRKYWNGEYHNSLYFSFDKDTYAKQ